MESEIYFRLTLLSVVILTTAITGFYRFQAASRDEKISRKAEGYTFAVVLRSAGLILFVTTFLYLLAPSTIRWAMMPVPQPIRWTGAVTGLLSSLMMYWTLSSLGKNLTDTVVTRTNATLITNGPYRWVRHPFYVTTALVMVSVTLLTANALIGVECVIVLTLLAVRTPKEERALIDRFGQRYIDYMQATGRFFPRFFPQWRRPNY